MLLKPFLIYLLILSAAAFLTYGIDKSRAKRGAWRISERTLLLFGFLGGAIGELVAMQLFRHKTKHSYFYFVNLLGLAWQAAALFYLAVNGL